MVKFSDNDIPDFMSQDWYNNEKNMGDGGYGDSFRALKAQIDYNYSRYKEQLVILEQRKQNLLKDKKDSLRMLLIIMLTPVGIYVLFQIFAFLGAVYGLFNLLAGILIICLPISVIICEFFMLPAAARNYINNIYRDKVLNLPGKGNNIITFVDEKNFIYTKLREIERFYERIEKYGIDQKGGKMKLGAYSGELLDADREILEEMRGMSLFKDYKATVSELKREASAAWLIIGLGLMGGVIIVIMALAFHTLH
ncbi:MAG: hypothetical protein J5684_03865 [Eubacterium sp.]|nr:hypothetical protein [Eubacterium sp.]